MYMNLKVFRSACLLILAGLLIMGKCFALTPAEEALQKGKDYFQKLKYDESINELTKSIQISPTSAAYNYRAYVYLLKDMPDKTISDCNDALKINPNDAQAYNNRAAAYQKKGDFDRAISDCNMAIKIIPDLPFPYKNRALAYFAKKEYGKSWEDVHKAEQFAGYKVKSEFIEQLKKASGREE